MCVCGGGELKNADVMSDDQPHKRASRQTAKDDMWIDQPPLHWFKAVCGSIAGMCEYQEEKSACA